jgi:DNA processing protein
LWKVNMTTRQGNSADIGKWLRLAGAENLGPATFLKFLEHFGSVDRALGASVGEMTNVAGIGFKKAERIAATRDKFDVKAELELADELGVWIINLEDARYPVLLKRIYDPPAVLYVKGTLTRSDNLGIGIVGSRRCSLYGQEQASRFGYLLASAGFTICSGMARGIDTAAHQGALSAGERTIAVQGCGLSKIFPPENAGLFELIAASGACVSELPLGYEPLSENFPPRNRIIAGLSLGVIVVEASLRSGALISARLGLENDREVMAVPGRIDSPLSKGTHQLIKQGARLIESVEDVIDALGYVGGQLANHTIATAERAEAEIDVPLFDVSQLSLSDSEKLIYGCLGDEPMHIEQIIAEADLSPGSINAALISLRLKGLIKQLPGNVFCKKSLS